VPGRAETRFTRSGDVDIAYQTVGDAGGRDLLFLPGWVSHLEVMWELAEFASFLDALAGLGRLLVFDKRGTGLSDRVPGLATLEERASDVGAVLDAAGSHHAAIAAWGDGAAIAAMFAATYPERVDGLVLGSLSVRAGPGSSLRPDPAIIGALADAVERSWGQATLVPLFAPSMVDDERFRTWYRRWETMSTTPNAAAATLRWATEFDLGPILPIVQAPTLILHRKDTGLFDLDAIHAAAATMQNARCVELPGPDDLPYVGDVDALVAEIEEFLTGRPHATATERTLSTVMFTDIVESTQKAEQLGDRRWRYLLEDQRVRVRKLLDRFRGVEVDTAGDGFFATFDGPARAVQCACAVRDAVREIGLEVRAGLHTGEVERDGTTVAGVAVHVGARVAALAAASEVLVTSTVQMLVLGSGIRFVDRGTHSLKGVAEPWQLFAVDHS
jgi:class 3 adenylate cyclase/alpha-beta hydrolase superfamily lysophospholipase